VTDPKPIELPITIDRT